MSMKVLTVLQFSATLFWYLVLTAGIPALIFHRKVSGFGLSVRFFFYLLVGNFSLMNLVFALQLLHISNRATLTIGTCILYLGMDFLINRRNGRALLLARGRVLQLLLDGQMGTRTFLLRIFRFIGKQIRRGFRFIGVRVKGRRTEWIAFAAVTVLVFWQYGRNLLINYAYGASDIIVHNYWINSMSQGELFVAGVYPFGFHCIIYYLHTVTGLDTYVLLRVFCLVQTLLVHYSLLVFLKVCCKNRYLPYAGVAIYAGLDIFVSNAYLRFFSSLPQEFGMLFILPSIFFLFLFFQRKKEELEQGAITEGQSSLTCLVAFGIAFSMTISAHFYNTMIAGIFCAAIAVGYFFRLFRKQYFGRVMITGILSVFLAVLPMGIAVAMGTPLEGSLQWGMSIISADSADEEETEASETSRYEMTDEMMDETTEETAAEITETTEEESETSADIVSASDSWQGGTKTTSADISAGEETTLTLLPERVWTIVETIQTQIIDQFFNEEASGLAAPFMFLLAAVPLLGALLLLSGSWRESGARLLSAGICLDVLVIVLASPQLGLPTLMDESRCSIYLAYIFAAVLVLLADILWDILTVWLKNGRVKNMAMVLCIVLGVTATVQSGNVRNAYMNGAFGTNGAVTCLTNIIRDNRDFTWTICSANDELRMGEGHGYHYEISDFLYRMEAAGEHALITIPTQYVYFFIEKVPIDYYLEGYEGSGQAISEEGAEQALPYGSSTVIYQLENRWIMMSRMYYWAQAYMELYPNEFQVYYETDEFVCYYIEQNTYYLYNFAIDYGYNNVYS
ncbi:MAG: hypothetical protein LIO76_03780 [Clostridiales bacterium]|nr:hypothetical protein [Clostridiales bacterium]